MKKLLIFISMMILLSSFVSANISIRADANFKDTIDTYKVQEYGKTYLVNDKPLVQDKNLKVYQSMNVINDDEEVSLFVNLLDKKLSNDYVICFDFGHFKDDFIIISGEQVKQFWFNKNLLSTGVFEFLNYKCINSIDISNFNEIKYRLKYEGFIPYKNYQIKYDVIIFPYYDNLGLKGSFSDSKYHNNLIVLDIERELAEILVTYANKVVKLDTNKDCYLIKDGEKHLIPDEKTAWSRGFLLAPYDSGKLVEIITRKELNKIPVGSPVKFEGGKNEWIIRRIAEKFNIEL